MRIKSIKHNYSLKLRNRKEYEIFRNKVYEKNNRNDLIYIDELNHFLDSYDNNFKSLFDSNLDIIYVYDEKGVLIFRDNSEKENNLNREIINSLQNQISLLNKKIDKYEYDKKEKVRIENEIYFANLQLWVLRQDDLEYAYKKLWNYFENYNDRDYRMNKIFNSDLRRKLR